MQSIQLDKLPDFTQRELLDFYHFLLHNTSDSLRSDSTIITEVCEGLAGFYGTEVEF